MFFVFFKLKKLNKHVFLIILRSKTEKTCFFCNYFKLKNSKIKGEIFNVGSGKLVSIEELATIISNSGKKFYRYEPKVKKISGRKDKVWPDRFMSICKIRKKIGWKPEISLTNGIELMVENRRYD